MIKQYLSMCSTQEKYYIAADLCILKNQVHCSDVVVVDWNSVFATKRVFKCIEDGATAREQHIREPSNICTVLAVMAGIFMLFVMVK